MDLVSMDLSGMMLTGVTWAEEPWVRALGVVLVSGVMALLSSFITRQTIGRLASRTDSTLDDEILEILKKPVAVTCLLIGAWYAYVCMADGEPDAVPRVWRALLTSIGVIVWAKVAIKGGRIVLFKAKFKKGSKKVVANRLLPIFDMALKIVVICLAAYYVMLAWGINVSGWIASAGVLGVAFGFAAQETLGNIMSGIGIMADAPYKLGDWVVLDDGQRGRVTDIGLRSTRILTMDEVEMVVPNSVMGNSIITNESGGPSEKVRIQLPIGVAYGSDLDHVKEVLSEVVNQTEGVILDDPKRKPSIKFTEFGDSSLNLMLSLWIPNALGRPALVDRLNMAMYKALNREEIDIPFQTHSVYIHQVND